MVLGDTVREKSGNARVTNAGCVSIPPELVPVTASMRVPGGVALVVETVRIEVPVPLIEAGLKFAVTPAGAPMRVADRLTLPVKPFPATNEMVAVPGAPPGVSARVLGDDASVKYGFVVEVGARATIMPCPFGVPHPVTMSKPVMAVKDPVNPAGTVEPLGLLPLVMS